MDTPIFNIHDVILIMTFAVICMSPGLTVRRKWVVGAVCVVVGSHRAIRVWFCKFGVIYLIIKLDSPDKLITGRFTYGQPTLTPDYAYPTSCL